MYKHSNLNNTPFRFQHIAANFLSLHTSFDTRVASLLLPFLGKEWLYFKRVNFHLGVLYIQRYCI